MAARGEVSDDDARVLGSVAKGHHVSAESKLVGVAMAL
jgi:hypothetical protein